MVRDSRTPPSIDKSPKEVVAKAAVVVEAEAKASAMAVSATAASTPAVLARPDAAAPGKVLLAETASAIMTEPKKAETVGQVSGTAAQDYPTTCVGGQDDTS